MLSSDAPVIVRSYLSPFDFDESPPHPVMQSAIKKARIDVSGRAEMIEYMQCHQCGEVSVLFTIANSAKRLMIVVGNILRVTFRGDQWPAFKNGFNLCRQCH